MFPFSRLLEDEHVALVLLPMETRTANKEWMQWSYSIPKESRATTAILW